MGKWRTIQHPGAAYFVTSTIVDFAVIFGRNPYIDVIIENLNFYRKKYGFNLYAFVIMPEHVHLIVHPPPLARIGDIMRDFKSYTSKELSSRLRKDDRAELLNRLLRFSSSRARHPIWIEGNRPTGIYTNKVLRTKIDYIHANPIRRGLVQDLASYPYSSYRNYFLNDESLISIDRNWL